jgi:virulence-associated protein VagC
MLKSGKARVYTPKVFKLGQYQAIQLPKEIQFKSKELAVFRQGNEIILREPESALRLFELTASLPADLEIADRKKDVARRRNFDR